MNRWDRRIERALALEEQYLSAAEFLRFYRDIVRFQRQVTQLLPPVSASSPVFELTPHAIPEPMKPYVAALLELLKRVAPKDLAQTAELLSEMPGWPAGDPAVGFLCRVLSQTYAEHLVRGAVLAEPVISAECPFCEELPVTAVLRPEGDGGKRSLVCSLCFTEWDFRRLECLACGEKDHQKLPVYTTEHFSHIRIEACDTCRHYWKSIDMTRNGLAVPEVDEMASLPLDIWAVEHDYEKLQTNLFGL